MSAYESVAMETSSKQENKPMVDPPPSEHLPPESQLAKIYDQRVLNKDGESVKFSTLAKQSETSKTLVVFIRHFYCGACQAYVQALTNDLPPSKLAAQSTTLIIIGCGEPELISKYVSKTDCPFAIYADPTRKLYDLFGFVVNLTLPKKSPDYITKGFMTMLWDGMKQEILSGTKIFSGGKSSQNGGELLLVDGELQFIHRMTNTQDHLEIRDLEVLLGQ